MMSNRILSRLRDMRTASALMRAAERAARDVGDGAAGEEHYLLAAFELPDGSARGTFARLGVDPSAVAGAIAAVHADALASVGVPADVAVALQSDAVPAPHTPRFPAVTASGQALLRRMATDPTTRDPLLGVHVLGTLAGTEHGTAARVLERLGIGREALATAVAAELSARRARSERR